MKKSAARQIIILGAGVMQGPAIVIAQEMGLETVVVDGDPRAVNAALATAGPAGGRFERIDLKDREGIEALARELQGGGRLGGIFTAGTDFSATVAWVAERLALPGIPWECALNATDKSRMRACFARAGVPSPRFAVYGTETGGGYSAGFPAVVKPVDNMGARGCRRVENPAELALALPEALAFSRSGRAIVEEFMEGPEFSVDALVWHGEIFISGLADRHIFFPPFFVEMGHTIPANLGQAEADRLLEVFVEGVRALGLLDGDAAGAAKGDVKLTPAGPMIGEIAARLSGGYMSGWTWPYASGVEVTRGAIQAALGERPGGLEARRAHTCAERAFISIPGRVRALYGLREARALPFVKDLFLRIGPGDRVRFPENNVSKCGNVLASAPDRESACHAAESAARAVLIALDPEDGETARFLGLDKNAESDYTPQKDSVSSWPPAAFVLDDGLAAIPDPAPGKGGDPSGPAPDGAVPAIPDFPEFRAGGLRDWQGRTVDDCIEAARKITGLALPLVPRDRPPDGKYLLLSARAFWKALARGGYQGAAFMVERFLAGTTGQDGYGQDSARPENPPRAGKQ